MHFYLWIYGLRFDIFFIRLIIIVVVAVAFLVSLQWIYELLCHLKVIKMPSDLDGKKESRSLIHSLFSLSFNT